MNSHPTQTRSSATSCGCPRGVRHASAIAITVLLLAVTYSLSPTPLAAAAESDKKTFSADTFSKRITPLLVRYCNDCHGPDVQEADIAFNKYPSVNSVRADREAWMKVDEMVLFGAMPPDDEPHPSQEERKLISDWIQSLFATDCSKQRDPGRETVRRLNRTEYDNTIRDLTGLDLHLADEFPSDDVGEGFDNIGDVLSLPPLLFEKYMDAAERVAKAAIIAEPVGAETQRKDLPDSHRRIVIVRPSDDKSPKTAAREILERFAGRAFRRPVKPDELTRLVGLVELALAEGDSFERGIQVAVSAVLVSPQFLIRMEIDPSPDDPRQIRILNDYELATRLSYFLWSSMPDDELFALAAQGTLGHEDVLHGQVTRMLQDPKAQALVENFGGQWLNLRNLEDVTPDPVRFASFDDALRRAMRRETELFFAAVMREDRSIVDFLSGDFSFVDARLARHYGIKNVRGDQFRRISLSEGNRRGLLTHASILTLTSNPTRTSPVKRGKWIMENILGTPPPEPPGDIPMLEVTQEAAPNATLREQMVMHRENPVCASCHLQMDALGFGFENFDPVGRWRDRDGEKAIDAAGKLPSGEQFSRPTELVAILANMKRDFSEALSRKMLTYALGRGLEPFDDCAIQELVHRLEQDEYRFSSLVLGIVVSDPFRKRRGE